MHNLHVRQAAITPSSFNETALTVEAIISTFAPVQRRDNRGVYTERLDPAGLDTAGLVGAPVLDGHRQGSARDAVGVITAFRTEGNALVATLRFTDGPDAAPIVARVRQGVVRGVSVGYRVGDWRETTDPKTRARVRTAAAWTILEVSAVPVPADPGATFRGQEMIENQENNGEQAANNNAEQTVTETRAAIRQIARAAGLPTTWADEQIDAESTVVEARSAAFEAMQDRRRTAPNIRTQAPSNDDPAVIVRRQSDALAHRMGSEDLPDDARQHLGLSMLDMARDALGRAGVSTRGMTPDEVFTRAGQHTTSDFPLVVSNAMNKIALERYKAAETPLKALCRKRVLPNFKESTAIRLSGMGRLEEMTESGEFTHTTRAEEGESLHLRTFGRAINLSRKLIINDDAGLLGDMVSAFGDAAAQTEADELVALVTGSKALSDGKPVFHASRKNIGAGSDITIAALDEARRNMRLRTDLDGKTLISATPKFLLVGADRETEAETILAAIQAANTESVNPFAGKLQLLVEPRITDGSWHLFADPARLAALAFAYLGSAQGVQVQKTEAWDVLGTKYRAFLDFGCGWTDWRGAYRNPGK